MGAKIKYKGVEVASIESGQTATLHCKDSKMAADIVVEANENPDWDGSHDYVEEEGE